VDYLEEYVARARARYPEHERLRFEVGDAQHFLYRGLEGQFDVVVSFHTLEHVPDDGAMVAALHRNLRAAGTLIVEVPLLAARPMGVPINPYHLREYSRAGIAGVLERGSFEIVETLGVCRGLYGPPAVARKKR
jgi:SAM-dependent methyltransferase